MTEIIAVINQKGGVGKTTTATNLASCLALLGKKTLLIDADPQGNSTSGLGISRKDLKSTFYDFLLWEVPLAKVRVATRVPNLDVLPSNNDSLTIGRELVAKENGQACFRGRLRAELEDPANDYEYVIVDSPPNLEMMVINIMICADRLIIPTQPDYYSLEGLADLVETYRRIKTNYNHDLSIMGVLITMYAGTNNLSKEVTKNLRANMGPLVFDTVIPRNVKLAEAPSHCLPIMMYEPKCPGATAYQQLTSEVLAKAIHK